MQINIFYNTPMPRYYRVSGRYRAVAASALGALAKKPGELNIIFVSEREILKINQKYIRHNYVTDVITFPYPGPAGAGHPRPSLRGVGDSPLGGAADAAIQSLPLTPYADIFICFKQALRQAKEQGHGGLLELLIVAAHGALHLAGYDDKTPAQRAQMNAKAKKIALQI